MTTIDVREVGPCPELDAACAEALGLKLSWTVRHWTRITMVVDRHVSYPLRKYSKSIVAAWKLVEAMLDDELSVELQASKCDLECVVYEPDEVFAHSWVEVCAVRAETAPLAISRAFLLAHGVTELEVSDD